MTPVPCPAAHGHPVWLEVDLGVVEQNVRAVHHLSGMDVMAVVKANAYGYGAVPVANAALRGGATWLGVARVDEAVELRREGIVSAVLVLGMPPYALIETCIAHAIHLPAGSFEAVETMNRCAAAAGRPLHVHLKVDTGMGRLGVLPEETVALAQRILAAPWLQLAGLFSHLANADRQDDPLNALQARRFDQAVAALEQQGIRPRWVHLANTAAALRGPRGRSNLVRGGQLLVGHNSFSDGPLHPALRLAMHGWKARLAGCWEQGGNVYGMVSAGFGDGYWRQPGNEVLLGGRRQAVLGLPEIDCMILRLDRAYPPGSEVALAGAQGDQIITIQDLARHWGTGPGKITAVLPERLPRLYGDWSADVE